MVVTPFKYELFCGDYGDIVIDNVERDVTLSMSIHDNTILQEVYHPDAAGKVIIRGLGDVLINYFDLPDVTFSTGSINLTITVQLSYRIDGGVGYQQAQTVHYSTVKTNGTMPFNKFLTRAGKKYTTKNRQELISVYAPVRQIDVGVAFLRDGAEKYYKTTLDKVYGCTTENVSLWRMYELLTDAEQLVQDYSDILFWDVCAVPDNVITDKVRYINDRRMFSNSVKLLYYNCFGVLDTLCFTGLEKKTSELSGTFSNIGGQYRKINTDVVTTHQLSTGYIDRSTEEAIIDLLQSPHVYIYGDNPSNIKEITITDANIEDKGLRHEARAYAISYRFSDKIMEFNKENLLYKRIFDKTFDYTFG